MHAILALALLVPRGELPDGSVARLGAPEWRSIVDKDSVLAFTPDGGGVVITNSGSLRALNFETGAELWKMPAVGWFPSGGVAPEGRLVIGAYDWLRVYDAKDGTRRAEFTVMPPRGEVKLVVADAGRAAVRDELGRVTIVDLTNGARLWEYGGRSANADCFPIGFVADQPFALIRVVGKGSDEVRVLDFIAKRVTATWPVPRGTKLDGVNTLALSPNGRLVWAAAGREVRLWDAATGKPGPPLGQHSAGLVAGAFSADGRHLVTAAGQELRWWDVARGRELGRRDAGGVVRRLAVSADGFRAAAICDDETTVRRFDLKRGPYFAQEGHTDVVERVFFLPDGKRLLSASLDGNVILWEVAARGEVRRWGSHARVDVGPRSHFLTISSDGKLAASLAFGSGASILELDTGKQLRSFAVGYASVNALEFAPTGTALAVAAGGRFPGERDVELWDAATGKLLIAMTTNGPPIVAMAFAQDAGRLITTAPPTQPQPGMAPIASPAEIWDLEGRRVRFLTRATGPLAVLPDGRSVVMMRPPLERPSLALIELASGHERLTFGHVPGESEVFAVSPDGRLLATLAPYSRTKVPQAREPGVYLWDAETGRELRRLRAAHVMTMAFSPDGTLLATGAADGAISLWDVANAAPKHTRTELSAKLWDLLAGDAATAYQAIIVLGYAGEPAVAFLRERLKSTQRATAAEIAQMFKDLDHERYAVRHKAQKELFALDLSANVLRERLDATVSAEARKVIQFLLERPDGLIASPPLLRELRAVEALERNGTAAAKQFLQALAAGDPAARLTLEARKALRLR